MSTSIKMEEGQSHMTEKILNLTLEIIYLLTGESYPPLKSGDHVTITVPPCDSLKPKRQIVKKILEVTNKITELLTGEDVPAYVLAKEWEYLEGHKDLYKDVMMEDQPPLTSPDVSRKRKPPETRPRPLEDLTIPHHGQGGDRTKIKLEEDVEDEAYGRLDQQCTGKFIEKEGMTTILIEVDGTTRTILEEDVPPEIRCKMEDEGETALDGSAQEEKTFPCPECAEIFSSESTLCVHLSSHMGDKYLYCYECGKCFLHKFELVNHYRTHTGEKPYSCPECGKKFSQKFNLTKHERSHTGEKPYFCTECGKFFSAKSALNLHQRIHTGERPFCCLDCGKSFSQKAHLASHQSLHTGYKPFQCSECGKRFLHKSKLRRHYKTHLKKKKSCFLP